MHLSVLYVGVFIVLVNLCYAQIDIKKYQENKGIGLNSSDTEEITKTPEKPLDEVHVHLFKFLKTLKRVRELEITENNSQEGKLTGPLRKRHNLNDLEGKNVDIRLKRSPYGGCRGRCGRRKHKCSRCEGYGGHGGYGHGGETIGYIPIKIQRPVQYIPHQQPNYGCNQCGGGYPTGGQHYTYSQASASASSSSYGRRK